MEKNYIHVDEYISDKNHAGAGLKKALLRAKINDAKGIIFGEGTYIIDTCESIETLSAAHDDGQGNLREKEVQMLIADIGAFHLKGTRDKRGNITTTILGVNNGNPNQLLPSLLWAENLDKFTLEDLAFGRSLKSVSAAIVTDIIEDRIHVRMEEGLPVRDKMGAYCMNRFDLKKGQLIGESLTFGFGYDNRWRKVGERDLVLKDPVLAEKIQAGEGLSWHQSGRTDFLLFFGNVKQLALKNIRILDSNGFCLLTEFCGDIEAEAVDIRPEEPAFFTGPRDGWKIYRCYGDIIIRNTHIQGVRMDGQNVHSTFLKVEKILGDGEILASAKYAPTPLKESSILEFQTIGNPLTAKIKSWSITDRLKDESIVKDIASSSAALEQNENFKNIYRISFTLGVELNPHVGMEIIPQCWVPKSYHVTQSTFQNIAGAGQLLRARNILIDGCRYEHMMNAGILLGAELDVHAEGPHAEDVEIRNCTFIKCGTKPRYGYKGKGGVSVASQGFNTPVNRRILIKDNLFYDCGNGIEIHDAEDVYLTGNKFMNTINPVVIDEVSTRNIIRND